LNTNAQDSVIIGGSGNTITGSDSSVILGGIDNITSGLSTNSSIVGGQGNRVKFGSKNSVIAGGVNNLISLTSTSSAIIGGENNTNLAYSGSVILGGNGITVNSNDAVYVPSLSTKGFFQQSYATVGPTSTTLAKETSAVFGFPTTRTGSITTTLPASPLDGQRITLKRGTNNPATWTITPNAGTTLTVNGVVGNYIIPVDSSITIILVGTNWLNI